MRNMRTTWRMPCSLGFVTGNPFPPLSAAPRLVNDQGDLRKTPAGGFRSNRSLTSPMFSRKLNLSQNVSMHGGSSNDFRHFLTWKQR